MFTSLPPGVKYPNSLLQWVPFAFCHDVGETHPLLRAISEKVEPQLPHKGEVFGIDGIQVEMKDFGIFKLYGHQGQGATCDCIQCLERFWGKGPCFYEPSFRRGVSATYFRTSVALLEHFKNALLS